MPLLACSFWGFSVQAWHREALFSALRKVVSKVLAVLGSRWRLSWRRSHLNQVRVEFLYLPSKDQGAASWCAWCGTPPTPTCCLQRISHTVIYLILCARGIWRAVFRAGLLQNIMQSLGLTGTYYNHRHDYLHSIGEKQGLTRWLCRQQACHSSLMAWINLWKPCENKRRELSLCGGPWHLPPYAVCGTHHSPPCHYIQTQTKNVRNKKISFFPHPERGLHTDVNFRRQKS